MPQLFSRRATLVFRALLVLVPLVGASAGAAAYFQARSNAAWNVGVPAAQPIPFQHDLHAGTLGIDCRFCHASVERAAAAGMPSAETCLNCHNEIWVGASVLEPLRTSLGLGQSVPWVSVSRLPEHAFFHHAAHVAKGVPCATCHGAVEEMTETVKTETFSMGWCLDCHRDPASHLQDSRGEPMTKLNGGMAGMTPPHPVGADTALLTSCSTCHR